MNWIPAAKYLQEFSGLRKTTILGSREYGVFKERYGRPWSMASRPIDSTGNALACWGHGSPCDSMREAVGLVERMTSLATVAA